ncbi:Krueppel-like factor 10 [Mugil cephalus]|uniref:Krueppel-like factor 10 n=1 Tax=Mugil cephalus TaxID=48193 RepID=UPI001FB658EC|nr:Krueppel-like factor 10 [Mugil cephalus]
MSSRLAFQTQLASIMEVLANAAVAEICKLVDDDYAVVSLQMSQCQRENKALKRKLHLLELKMARGNAERRLRESAMNSCRPRGHLHPGDKPRESSPCIGGVFSQHVNVTLWSGRATARDATSEPVLSEHIQSKSPDVQLVESEPLLVKEEKVEADMSQELEEDVTLMGDGGVLEHVPHGAVTQRPSHELQDTQSTSSQSQNQIQTGRARFTGNSSNNSRGVEKDEEPDVVLVKVEEVNLAAETPNQTDLNVQEGLVESSTDDYRGVLPFDETTHTSSSQMSDLQDSRRGFSETAASHQTSVVSEDTKSVVVVQPIPDTKAASSPTTQQQRQHKASNKRPLSSEYSLFDLETLFTQWAPSNESASVPTGPCSFTTHDLKDSDQDGVIIVETPPQPQHGIQLPRTFSSAIGRFGPQDVPTGVSMSTPLRLQAASSQHPWASTPALMKSARAQLLQPHCDVSKISPQQPQGISSAQGPPKRTSARNTKAGNIRRMSSRTVAPQASLPVRGSTAELPGTEVAVGALHKAGVPGRNMKRKATSSLTGMRRKSHVCQSCGKAFPGLSNLEAHERVHTGEKPFCCSTCGKSFSEAGNLKKHQRVHTGEKPFSCDQCGKTFAWICNLRTHKQSATCCGAHARGGLKMH